MTTDLAAADSVALLKVLDQPDTIGQAAYLGGAAWPVSVDPAPLSCLGRGRGRFHPARPPSGDASSTRGS